MIRVKRGRVSHVKHKKILRYSKGFRGAHSRLFRTANGQVLKSYLYSYIGRRICKRDFKKLSLLRVNAWIKQYSYRSSYTRLRALLRSATIKLNLQSLAQMAILDPMGLLQMVNGLSSLVANKV